VELTRKALYTALLESLKTPEEIGGPSLTKFLRDDGSYQSTTTAGNSLGWNWIKNKTASNQATLDFVFPAGFKEFWITYYNVKPEINDRGWNSKLSNDGGTTFIDGTDYRSAAVGVDSVEAIDNGLGTLEQEGIQSTSRWRLVEQDQGNRGVGNDTDEGVAGSMFVKDPLNATTRTRFTGQAQYTSAANTEWIWTHGGAHHAIETHNAIRFLFQSGDIVLGDFSLFGLKVT